MINIKDMENKGIIKIFSSNNGINGTDNFEDLAELLKNRFNHLSRRGRKEVAYWSFTDPYDIINSDYCLGNSKKSNNPNYTYFNSYLDLLEHELEISFGLDSEVQKVFETYNKYDNYFNYFTYWDEKEILNFVVYDSRVIKENLKTIFEEKALKLTELI